MTAVALAACGRLTARQRPFTASCKQHAQLPTRRRPAAATGGGSDGGSSELPPELQDLCISEDGQYLIDNKTGKVVNEFGATRFDVAVRGEPLKSGHRWCWRHSEGNRQSWLDDG